MDAIVVVLTAITRSSANRNGWESLSNSDLRLIAISKNLVHMDDRFWHLQIRACSCLAIAAVLPCSPDLLLFVYTDGMFPKNYYCPARLP